MPVIFCDSIDNVAWDESADFRLDGVSIWRIDVSENIAKAEQLLNILSEEEKARAARYHHEKDRQRYIVSRVALRSLAGNYLGLPVSDILFTLSEHKKPYVSNGGIKPFHYNVSHSGNIILVVTSCLPVGIDVEKVNPDFNFRDLLSNCFSEQEISFVNGSQDPHESFYLLWTRKESLMKATAQGIDNDLPMVPSMDGIHAANAKVIGSGLNWKVTSFKVAEEYIAAMACPSEDKLPVSFFKFTMLGH